MKAVELYPVLDEIRSLIAEHTDENGELTFDGFRFQVALDFSKKELLNSISKVQAKEAGE